MPAMRNLLLVVALLLGLPGSALADQNDVRLDRLFNQLAAVRTPTEAAGPVAQIDTIWAQSGSDTVDLLMARAASVVEWYCYLSTHLPQVASKKKVPDAAEQQSRRNCRDAHHQMIPAKCCAALAGIGIIADDSALRAFAHGALGFGAELT